MDHQFTSHVDIQVFLIGYLWLSYYCTCFGFIYDLKPFVPTPQYTTAHSHIGNVTTELNTYGKYLSPTPATGVPAWRVRIKCKRCMDNRLTYRLTNKAWTAIYSTITNERNINDRFKDIVSNRALSYI